ncbi:MAG: hypothetical protein JW716_03395 [Candidatus Aenigmarchaeota archaeon]|nr:hypothetical protein [Candidatus Aenigmarchaeota archaeon]
MRIGQAHMMEYILLTVFIIILMVAFMIMMTVFQIGGVRSEGAEHVYRQSITTTRFIVNSPYFNNPRFSDGSVFDDSKLSVADCEELREVIGEGWFAFVVIPGALQETLCDEFNYPECNKWIICDKADVRKETCVHEVPVNIYRKMDDTIDIGILTVGLYGKCT